MYVNTENRYYNNRPFNDTLGHG